MAEAAAESDGVRIKLFDWGIGRILKARDHHRLAQNADQLTEEVAVLWQQLDEVASELGHLEVEMLGQRMDSASSGEYIVHFF